MTLYLKIKEIREKKGLTQLELANKLGTTYQVISDYERNKRTPSIERAMQLADALECSLDDLVDMQAYIYNLYNKKS